MPAPYKTVDEYIFLDYKKTINSYDEVINKSGEVNPIGTILLL
jgi:hypothetical protein